MKMSNFVWFYVIAVSFPAAATTVLRCHWRPFGLEASIFKLNPARNLGACFPALASQGKLSRPWCSSTTSFDDGAACHVTSASLRLDDGHSGTMRPGIVDMAV